MLERYEVRLKQRLRYAVNILPVHASVCARNYNDSIVIFAYSDKRNACRNAVSLLYVVNSDAFVCKILNERDAVRVVSHTAEHLNVRSESCHSYSLVSALSALDKIKTTSVKSFAL